MQHRGRGSTDDAGGGELTVPMAWLYAEYIADEVLRAGDLMPPTSFEFRAGRDALALTVFLSEPGTELTGALVVSHLEDWLSLTAYDQPWRDWVRERMALLTADAVASGGVGPDLELAAEAWRWLEETELLAPDLDAVPGGAVPEEDEAPQVWTPAWQLGLPLGHLAIHLF
ncbi:hypothetical protein GCM10018793_06670 [Streptomyces sulfonofaciens]|uniref:Uncharacterized protein n=1 Tax=Streptomyces sulfonofaciens TaxID=68272 RepID=A0A919FSA8_9ACTN|nr:hypothetical protein [Streptomyces sulfonofaciens]GHH71466.1 hypothetical protein GCM10018793_06670 [Streptomyces sulfonofaciens]